MTTKTTALRTTARLCAGGAVVCTLVGLVHYVLIGQTAVPPEALAVLPLAVAALALHKAAFGRVAFTGLPGLREDVGTFLPDTTQYNPSTGLPMVTRFGVDVGGTAYGGTPNRHLH